MSNNLPALVLDFGGVMSRTLFETHALTERTLGLEPGTLTWLGPFDPATDPLWQRMQAGELTERDYWLCRARETGRKIGEDWTSMQEFVIAARGAEPAQVIRPECTAAVEAAAAGGHLLAVLSNELDMFYGSSFRQKLPLLDRFDVVVDATHTRILKPDPRAYQLVCDALDCQAGDCVFVDDQARNISGARAFGMRAVHFDVRNPADSYRQALACLGLEV